MSDEETLSEKEKALLGGWSPVEPRGDFADRVMAQVELGRPQRRFSGLAGWMALAATIAGITIMRFGHLPSEGTHRSDARTTLALGDRATVVAEGGAALSWRIGWDGAAAIEQEQGDVFYRVERGGAFLVTTPAGRVEVTGTSFRVEVEKMQNKTVGTLGAGAGALVASLVWVTVYEGSVVTASPTGRLSLAAGEQGELRAGEAPVMTVPQGRGRAALGTQGEGAPTESATQLALAKEETVETLRADRIRLMHRVGELEAKLEEAPKKESGRRGPPNYDLSPADLNAMADKCELRWDTLSLGSEPPHLQDKAAEVAQLSQEERAVVDRVFKDEQAKMVATIKKAYIELTGDETGSLSTQAMLMELDDKVPEGEMKVIFQRISAERAGRAAPPADMSRLSPTERVYRMLLVSGEILEQSISDELGPGMGRKVRAAGEGWPSSSRSSYGCPP